MEHKHSVYDSDTRFLINSTTRQIRNDASRKSVLIQNDHNSERFSFELPRYIEGHDMSACNKVEVHYLNISTDKKTKNSGVYTVDDLQVCPDDPEKAVCSWLISNNATQLVGSLAFLLRFCCLEGGVITYAWNTAVCSSIFISEGINADLMFEAEYLDIIEQWKRKATQEITDAVNVGVSEWKETESGNVRAEMTAFSAQWNQALSVERARIDQFTQLPAGSTAGDAELMDIRVGADGDTYNNAGTAVRSQVKKLSDDITDVFKRLMPYNAKFDKIGYVLPNGNNAADSSAFRTGLIPCVGYDYLSYKSYIGDSAYMVAFYDSSKAFISSDSILGKVLITNETISIPESASFVQVCGYTQPFFGVDDAFCKLHNSIDVEEEIKLLRMVEANVAKLIPAVLPFSNGPIYWKDGTLRTDSNYYSTEPYPISGYRYLKYKTNLSSDAYHVAFLDEGKVLLPDISVKTVAYLGKENTIDLSLINASYVVVSGYNDTVNGNTADKFVAKLMNRDIIDDVDGLKYNKFESMKMLVFGDSITQTAEMDADGSNYTEGYTTNWVTYIPEYLGVTSIKNYAMWGAHYADFVTDYPRQKLTTQLSMAMSDSSNDDADIIVLSLGTNDQGQTPVDSYEEAMNVQALEDLDNTRMYQAIRYAMWSIKTKYPDAVCFAATPIQRADREPGLDITEAIVSMAHRYNFILIDAENESGIIKENEVWRSQGKYLVDGLHPNIDGKKLMANLYSNVIKRYI